MNSLLRSLLELNSLTWVGLGMVIDRFKSKLFSEDTTSNYENIANQVVVITGAQRGIGKVTAIEFAKRGAVVVLGCVDLKEGRATQEEIKRITNNMSIDLVHLVLSEMASVREFAQTVKSTYPDIKVLWNNAGLGGAKDGINVKTKDGFNLQMAVNYLGHFLLTNLLVPNMKAGSRVLATSSSLMLLERLDLDDFMMDKTSLKFAFENLLPYVNSKMALSLFINELGRRLKPEGITCLSFCPGFVRTAIFEDGTCVSRTNAYLVGCKPEKTCDAILYCALNKSLKEQTGQMFRYKKLLNAANANLDPKLCQKVWDLSARLVNLEECQPEFAKTRAK